MIVLDTNVLSELMRPVASDAVTDWVNQQPAEDLFTTTITEAEIFYGIELLVAGERRDQLFAIATAMFEEDFAGRILPFDSGAARLFSTLAAQRRRAGRPISHADGQIAAIARTHGGVLATRDVADFHHCGVELINPWEA